MKNNQVTELDWTDRKWNTFTKWLVGILKTNEVTVVFTKKDGTERVMRCTLNPEVLPKQEVTEDKKPRKKADSNLAVYDLEMKGWRSFVIKSVKKVDLVYGRPD